MLKTLDKTKKLNLRIIYIIFVLGLFLILNGNIVSSICYIETSAATCTGNSDYIIMRLSDVTNAHGALAGQGTFTDVLCCNFGEGDTTCTADNKILGLSSSTNAHAEKPELSNYGNSVCYDSLTNCGFVSTTLASDEIEIIGLSSDTNAHLGGFNDYKSITNNKRIVCTIATSQACSLTSAEWQYPEALEGSDVGAIVNGTGCSGIEISFEVFRGTTSCNSISGCENPGTVTFGPGSNSVTKTWNATPAHDNEYRFVAEVVATGETVPSSTPDLLVIAECPYDPEPMICKEYTTESHCNSNICEIDVQDSVPTDINCSDPDIDCECIWNSTESECKASWEGTGYCGDGIIGIGETCDGTTWEPITNCSDFDVFTGGTLNCYAPGTSSECQFDTSQCTGGIEGAEIGTCIYNQSRDGNCDTDEFLTFSWIGKWTWDDGCGVECQIANKDKKDLCEEEGSRKLICPAQIPLPFFNIYSFVAALTIIALIYVILILRKEKRKR